MRTYVSIGHFQHRVLQRYQERGYFSDPLTLLAGVMEETGEMARAINNDNPLFISRTAGEDEDTLEHEMVDALVYIFALANARQIDLEQEIIKKIDGWDGTHVELC